MPTSTYSGPPTDMRGLHEYMLHNAKPSIPPFERLPCANSENSDDEPCLENGTRLCSGCRLVGYCSKGCQNKHWKTHKDDCKHPLRSSDWQPSYIREGRTPKFISRGRSSILEDIFTKMEDRYSQGLSLWANMPALDILNVPQNEKSAARDYKIAFIASGDLGSVVHTVCALPDDYSGKLTILVNDKSPLMASRNIMILLILGAIPDTSLAADIALHFWYSIAFPIEYRLRLQGVLASMVDHITDDDHLINFPLGARSNLNFIPTPLLWMMLKHFASSSISSLEALVEYSEIRNAPPREDYRERMYSGMKPSHRQAFFHYRQDGLLLPFGTPSEHFVAANPSLFSPDGSWLQTDFADPLGGYSLDAVIKAGMAHGAPPEDIYGCLYFYVSDQLRHFAKCLRNFDISIRIFDDDATDLSQMIRMGILSPAGVPSSIRFDRIDVSNILDVNYAGIEETLKAWGPLLSSQPKSTLLGYFMNWTHLSQPDGNVSNAKKDITDQLMKKLEREGKLPLPKKPTNVEDSESRRAMMNFIYHSPPLMQSIYENSHPFEIFLKKQSLPSILRRTGLKRKHKHTVIPYRLLSPLTGSATSLPEFTEESWYYEHQLTSHTWVERFIEFTWA